MYWGLHRASNKTELDSRIKDSKVKTVLLLCSNACVSHHKVTSQQIPLCFTQSWTPTEEKEAVNTVRVPSN